METPIIFKDKEITVTDKKWREPDPLGISGYATETDHEGDVEREIESENISRGKSRRERKAPTRFDDDYTTPVKKKKKKTKKSSKSKIGSAGAKLSGFLTLSTEKVKSAVKSAKKLIYQGKKSLEEALQKLKMDFPNFDLSSRLLSLISKEKKP